MSNSTYFVTVAEANRIAGWYDARMNNLLDDPMTQAVGAPVGDFAEEWGRQHRRMIASALKRATGTAKNILLAAMERYMP